MVPEWYSLFVVMIAIFLPLFERVGGFPGKAGLFIMENLPLDRRIFCGQLRGALPSSDKSKAASVLTVRIIFVHCELSWQPSQGDTVMEIPY